MTTQKRYCLEVTGDYACFTRPEMKVERVSYDVITPSAARAVFEAIFWKPAIRWQVRRIEVLRPVRWMNLRRNEVASVISEDLEDRQRKHPRTPQPASDLRGTRRQNKSRVPQRRASQSETRRQRASRGTSQGITSDNPV